MGSARYRNRWCRRQRGFSGSGCQTGRCDAALYSDAQTDTFSFALMGRTCLAVRQMPISVFHRPRLGAASTQTPILFRDTWSHRSRQSSARCTEGSRKAQVSARAPSADREIGPSTSLPRLPDFRLRRGPLVRESEGTFHRPCLPINHASSYWGSAKFGGGDVNRPRAADDFATIRARMEELRRERAQEAKIETRGTADRGVETRGLLRRLEGRQRPEPEVSPTGSPSRRYGSGR